MPGNVKTVRKRRLPSEAVSTAWVDIDTSIGHPPSYPTRDVIDVNRREGRFDFSGTQITESEGHPFLSSISKQKRGRGDVGGEFFTQRSYVVGSPTIITIRDTLVGTGTDHTYYYHGPALAYWPRNGDGSLAFPPPNYSSSATLDKKGAEAIARCAPGNPPANAAVAFGELIREGLPHLVGSALWKDKLNPAKGASEEFLNWEFGFKPLAADITSFALAISNAAKFYRQLERDAGKVVRRRYRFPTQHTFSEELWATDSAAVLGVSRGNYFAAGLPKGKVTRRVETTREQWFSGAFTYYLPYEYYARNRMFALAAKADQLLGLSLTPEVLWNLAPWTWAIDWFTNIGDVIHNVSRIGSGGLVVQYGYMMEHTIMKHTYTLDDPWLKTRRTPVIPMTLVTETKVRRKANPFGFGLTWDGLSDLQKAILAALGITRGSR